MLYELEIITDIYGPESNTGKRRILTKSDKVKKIFNLEQIEVEEYVDIKTGKHIKKYSGIYKDNVYYKVNKPYEELKSLLFNKTSPVVGFVTHSKNIKKYK